MESTAHPRSGRTIDLTSVAASFVHEPEDRRIKRGHLRQFTGARRILDVGCGEGVFLDLARAAGAEVVGVDASAAAAGRCAARGHQVEVGDAVEVLDRLVAARQQFDGVFLSHLVEHLPATAVASLLAAAAQLLAIDGRLVVVTPNARNLIVLSEVFWLDPTHVRPYPRLLLERLGAALGLRTVASYDDPASRPRRSAWRRWLAFLRSRLVGADRSSGFDAVVVFART